MYFDQRVKICSSSCRQFNKQCQPAWNLRGQNDPLNIFSPVPIASHRIARLPSCSQVGAGPAQWSTINRSLQLFRHQPWNHGLLQLVHVLASASQPTRRSQGNLSTGWYSIPFCVPFSPPSHDSQKKNRFKVVRLILQQTQPPKIMLREAPRVILASALLLLLQVPNGCQCYQYKVGDLDCWGLPPPSNRLLYLYWSGNHSFRVGDSLCK